VSPKRIYTERNLITGADGGVADADIGFGGTTSDKIMASNIVAASTQLSSFDSSNESLGKFVEKSSVYQ
jgi:hypothetical protein